MFQQQWRSQSLYKHATVALVLLSYSVMLPTHHADQWPWQYNQTCSQLPSELISKIYHKIKLEITVKNILLQVIFNQKCSILVF